jgi:NAD-dependent dihydropyrimidine dehydrogenase PreA subunit
VPGDERLKTDDPAKLRAAGGHRPADPSALPQFPLQRDDRSLRRRRSSNAATFYGTGLKGRFEEGKRTDDHMLKSQSYGVLHVVGGQLVEKQVPMLNALNEVLRDDFIRDSIAGVGRWNKVIEKAGIPFRLKTPHKAFHRSIGSLAGVKVSPDGAVITDGAGTPGSTSGFQARATAPSSRASWTRRRAGKVRQLDRAARHGHQSATHRLPVRPVQLIRAAARWLAGPHYRVRGYDEPIGNQVRQATSDRPRNLHSLQYVRGDLSCRRDHHDSRNYVVDASKCNFCMDCISPCPTGSIDNWRTVPRASVYGVDAQFGWDELPPKLPDEDLMQAELGVVSPAAGTSAASDSASPLRGQPPQPSSAFGSTVPPWSAAQAYTNLYGPGAGEKPVSATVAGNVRVTEVGKDYDTHHIVLAFGSTPFPVLEGQSIGIIPPGVDANGRPHFARQYSVASPRNGERPGYNNLSLTIKRVLEDHQGNPFAALPAITCATCKSATRSR